MCDDPVRARRRCDHATCGSGTAVDPIALAPVDEITITTLVDNSYDALMGDTGPARRTGWAGCPLSRLRSSRTGAPRPA